MNVNDLVTRLFFLTIIYIVGAAPDNKVNIIYVLLILSYLLLVWLSLAPLSHFNDTFDLVKLWWVSFIFQDLSFDTIPNCYQNVFVLIFFHFLNGPILKAGSGFDIGK